MAEDDLTENETNEDQEAEGKSKSKLIIIISVVVLSVILSIVATVFLLLDDTESGDGENSVSDEVFSESKSPAIYYDINPPFLVTFNVKGRLRYMQVFVSAMSREQSSLDALELHMPLVRNTIISAYSGLEFSIIQTVDGKETLRELTLTKMNGVLESEGSDPIENVFFTNFVLQ